MSEAVAVPLGAAPKTCPAPISMAFLFADTGGGHRASALAVKQAVDAAYPGFVTAVLIDPTIENHSPLIRRADSLYRVCVRSTPWIWAAIFHLTNRRATVWIMRRTVLRTLSGSARRSSGGADFDAVVSFHPLLSHAARHVADRVPGGAIAATVMTDLIDPHASWAHVEMDAVFVPNSSSAEKLIGLGLSAQRCHRVGLPVGSQFVKSTSVLPQRGRARAQLGLDDRFTVLLVGGGEGAGGLYRKARALLRRCPDVQVCVIAGRNRRLLQHLKSLAERTGGRLHPTGFVDNMAQWMEAADLVVTKAGPGTIAEALAVGAPMLITGHLRGQERRNPDFVAIGGAGFHERRLGRMVARIDELAHHPEQLERFVWSTRLLARPQAASDIAATLVSLVEARRRASAVSSVSSVRRWHRQPPRRHGTPGSSTP